jgi:hypothetical protein
MENLEKEKLIIKETSMIIFGNGESFSLRDFINKNRDFYPNQLHFHVYDRENTYFVSEKEDDNIRWHYRWIVPFCFDENKKFIGIITEKELLLRFAYLLRTKILKCWKIKNKYEFLYVLEILKDDPNRYGEYISHEFCDLNILSQNVLFAEEFETFNVKPEITKIAMNVDHPKFKTFANDEITTERYKELLKI